MANNGNFFASIDIGTSKIVVLFGEEINGKIEVFGQGLGSSAGVKKGSIVNVDQTSKAIREVLVDTCKSCNSEILKITTNISDLHLTTINQDREFPILGDFITSADIGSAIEHASVVPTLTNKRVLSSTIKHFTIDKELDIIDNPVDLKASLLVAHMHIAVVSNQSMSAIHKSIEVNNNLAIEGVVLDSIAGSESCITQDEKDNGVCFVDMGAGVTNISVFTNGSITYSAIYQLAGNSVTENISYAFNTTFAEAERIKTKCAVAAQLSLAGEDSLVEFKQTDATEDSYLSMHDLIGVIEDSYSSIYSLIKQDLSKQKLDRKIKSGFVLTGGATLLRGCDELLLKHSRIRAKIAKVNTDKIKGKEVVISNPVYSSALGLLMHNSDMDIDLEVTQQDKQNNFMGKVKSLFEL